MLALDVEIAVLTNVELDHHATYASLAELSEAFRAFLARRAGARSCGTAPSARARSRAEGAVSLRARAARADAGRFALSLARASR